MEYETHAECSNAYQKAHLQSWKGTIIKVDYERGRCMKNWVPRRRGGGYGGKKESGQVRFGSRGSPFERLPYLISFLFSNHFL